MGSNKAFSYSFLLLSMLCFSPGVIQGVLVFLGLSLISLSGACLFIDKINSLWKALNESEADLSFSKWFQSTCDRQSTVAADGRFQPIHNLIYTCTCTELVVKIDSKETHLSASVFVPVVVVEGAILLLQPVPEMLIWLENVKAQIKRYVSTNTL